VTQALTLQTTPERISTHGLFLITKPNPNAQDSTPPEQLFRIHSYSVEPISELRQLLPESESAEGKGFLNEILGEWSDELRARGGLGWAVILMILLELPLIEQPVPYILPMGILGEPMIPLDPNWTGGLASAINNGWAILTPGAET
jgi:hypothetical protein